ncbi:MAG: GNAT family N-acetyltransferase [Acidobacteriota bacterium]
MRIKSTYHAPELLTREHDRSRFGCGKPALNQYLKKYALTNQESEISRTYVTTRDGRVVGYYTLTFGSISHEQATEKIKADLPHYPIPIMLLARLAVDKRESGKGLGKGLLKDALLRTISAADIAGLRAILTHAKDDEAKKFYQKFGFQASPIEPLTLMLSINDIRASLV